MQRIDHPTVLIVDDEEDLTDMYAEYLKEDYDVRTAYNGGEAIVRLDQTVDVILLDRNMPGMRGEEVLSEIRQWMDWCRVIMVTGVEPDFDITSLSFDDYLQKPVNKDELREKVNQMLLLDEYDELIHEYISVSRRYAILKSNKDPKDLATSDDFELLEEQRKQIKEDMIDLFDEFPDKEFRDAFQQIHTLTESIFAEEGTNTL